MTKQQIPGFVRAFCLLVLAATPVLGQQLATEIGAGRFIEVTIPAPSLAGNLLGDPTEQPVSIYLPPSYRSSPNNRYPVLYLLHGFTGTNRTWIADSEPNSGEAPPESPDGDYGYRGYLDGANLDTMIASSAVHEMIVVAPNSRNAYKHSYYVNSVVTGNWEDYIVRDVVNYVDGNFRTLAKAESRGIAGHSGGGYGSVYIGMRHADVFSAVYALSPCCLGPEFSMPPFTESSNGELTALWQKVFSRLLELTSKEELPGVSLSSPEDFFLNESLAAGAAYSPNPDRPPLYTDYLYEERDGKLVRNEAAFEKRRAHSPFHMLDEYKQNLLSLRGLYLDFGQYELPDLASGNAEFSKALAERGIPHTLEIYAGGDHDNMIRERLETRVIAFFSDHLAF